MGLILWIDENKLVTDLLEKVFKKKNLAFYSLNDAKDFVYLVNDLRPQVIVIDSVTAKKCMENFKAQLEQVELKKVSWIVLGESLELSFIPNKLGEIHRPFDPFRIPELIEKIVQSNEILT